MAFNWEAALAGAVATGFGPAGAAPVQQPAERPPLGASLAGLGLPLLIAAGVVAAMLFLRK